MDVTRILAKEPDELADSDIAGYSIDALRESKVKEVILLGRRGPLQAAFSPKEIKEIDELSTSDLTVLPEEAALDEASKAAIEGGVDANDKKNADFMGEVAARDNGTQTKKVRVRFCVSPVEIIGTGGKVTAVRIEKNKLSAVAGGRIRPEGTGVFETIEVGLILRSVGYFGVKIPGVPFDEKRGTIANSAGRVLDSAGGDICPGEYVVGWAKRGPSGLIGTNRADSGGSQDAQRLIA